MLQERYDKLIRLIQDSSILSPRERAEWSALLELMNDKQINELEKILLDAENQDQAVRPAPVVPKALPAKPPQAVTPESLLKNLQPAKPIRPLEDVKRASQPTRIRDILAEKELPPGHPNPMQELELPNPADRNKPEVLPSPAPPIAKPAMPTSPIAKPRAGLEPSLDLSSLLAKKLSSQPPVPGRVLPKPPVPKVPIKPVVSSQVQREGKNVGVMLDKVRGLEGAGKVFEPAQPAQHLIRPRFYEKPNIVSLQSLVQLTLDNFTANKAIELLEPIKQLIRQYGYYETRSYLEQSPLYQAYVDTGAKVLGGQADFVQEWEGLMNQPDFEMFADLLIQMHRF